MGIRRGSVTALGFVAVTSAGCAGRSSYSEDNRRAGATAGGVGGASGMGGARAMQSAGGLEGEPDDSAGEPPEEMFPDTCAQSPARWISYTTVDELRALLVGRWQRCVAPQFPGEDVGVEFTDEHYYPLTRDASGKVIRLTGVDYEHAWTYVPNAYGGGKGDLVLEMLGEVHTDPPRMAEDPRQLRVTFSPVLSIYVPLE